MSEALETGPGGRPATASGNQQYSTFFVGDLFFGVDVLQVQEVLRTQPLTPIPQAPTVIVGLMNLRGQIVTAIDMRQRLGLPARGGVRDFMNMVVRTTDGPVSLMVDEIGDVLDTGATVCERPPENLDRATRSLIRGVYPLQDRLLLVLDTEQTVDLATHRAVPMVVRANTMEAGRRGEARHELGNPLRTRSAGMTISRSETSRGAS